MKTVRHYTLFLEIIGLCIILIMSAVAYMQLRATIVEDIISNQLAQIDEIEQYIDNQFELNIEMFELFSDAVQKGDSTESEYSSAVQYLHDFSDIYHVNSSYEITKIYIKEKQSIIFEGYNLGYGEMTKFLKDISVGETRLTPMIRSPERDTISSYLIYRGENNYLIGRLSLDRIGNIMETIANARGISIAIVSESGYVITSTAQTLPFEIAPDLDGYLTSGDETYIVTKETIDRLGNDLIVLVPVAKVSRFFDLLKITFPFFIAALSVLVVIKVLFYDYNITRPLVIFSEKLSEWEGGRLLFEYQAPLFNTLELRRIIDVFNKKTDDVNAYIEALNALNAELEVRESLYRDLVENVDEIIYSLDTKGNLTSLNRAFEDLLERDRSYMIGKNMLVLAAKDGQEQLIRQKLKSVKEYLEKVTFNYKATDVHMATRYFKVTWIPRLDEKGGLKQILGTQTEITELIKTQASLSRIFKNEKRKLESIVDEKNEALSNVIGELIEKEKLASLGHLVSGVSHEINTPLGVSVLANSFLERESNDMRQLIASGELTLERLNGHLNIIDETAVILNTNLSRATTLVKSFKEIAVRQNIEERETFNVREYIDMVMLSLKHEYKHRPINFDIKCAPDLTLWTYPGAISQILTNLIMNALNHAYDEGTRGTIKIGVKNKETLTRICFEDDGKGMSQETLDRIYEPFFTTNRGKGGSGLGLNVVYNIVTAQLEGRIKCTSVIGKGTRFDIEFDATEQ